MLAANPGPLLGDQTPALGEKDVLMIYASFSDEANTSSASNRASWVTDTPSYYQYASYGEVTLDFSETPILNLGITKAQATSEGAGSVLQRMRTAATSAGFNTGNFDILVYNFPPGPSIGGGAVASFGSIIFPGNFDVTGLIHEMGHALVPVGHPNLLEAGDLAYPTTELASGAGSAPFNMMGSSGGAGTGSGNWGNPINENTWNLPQKYRAGWVRNADFHDGTTSGVYRIYNNDVPSGSDLVEGRMLGIRIKLGDTATSFAPGTQTPDLMIGFQPQNTYRNDEAARGVTIDAFSREISYLIDATPNSVPPVPTPVVETAESQFGDFLDAFLTVGNSVNFPSLGYTLSAVATGGSGPDAWIDIRVETGPSAATLAPSLALRNSAQAIPRGGSTASDLVVGELAIFGGAENPSHLSLSGADASLFTLTGTKLYVKSGVALTSLVQGQLTVDVTLDDPSFTGVEETLTLSFDLIDDPLQPATTQSNLRQGLFFEKFAASTFSIPNNLPAVAQSHNVLDIAIPPRTVNGAHGYRYSGFLDVPTDGMYQFHSTNSFHGRLYIDGRLVIDSNDDAATALEIGDAPSSFLPLQAGLHEIEYVWFGASRSNLTMNVEWQGPGLSREHIPTTALYTANTGNQSPTVVGATYDLTDIAAIGNVVGTLTGGDPDGDDVLYEITAGNVGDAFAIDDKGRITVAAPLDANVTASYSLSVQITDGSLTDIATVTINVQAVRLTMVDLADLIGGGDGSLPGTAQQSTVVGRGSLAFATESPLAIDGTFIPRAAGTTVISTTGLTADFSAMNNAEVAGTDITNGYNLQASLSGQVINGITMPDFNDTQNHSVLNLHTSQGITFDIDQIENFTAGQVDRFTAIMVGPTGPSSTYAVLVDGVQVAGGSLAGTAAVELDIPLAAGDRFLTLVSGSGANTDVNNRHTVVVDPFLSVADPPLAGDYNRDDTVDAQDYQFWKQHFGESTGPGLQADGNLNGRVDLADYTIWRDNLGATRPSAASLAAAPGEDLLEPGEPLPTPAYQLAFSLLDPQQAIPDSQPTTELLATQLATNQASDLLQLLLPDPPADPPTGTSTTDAAFSTPTVTEHHDPTLQIEWLKI